MYICQLSYTWTFQKAAAFLDSENLRFRDETIFPLPLRHKHVNRRCFPTPLETFAINYVWTSSESGKGQGSSSGALIRFLLDGTSTVCTELDRASKWPDENEHTDPVLWMKSEPAHHLIFWFFSVGDLYIYIYNKYLSHHLPSNIHMMENSTVQSRYGACMDSPTCYWVISDIKVIDVNIQRDHCRPCTCRLLVLTPVIVRPKQYIYQIQECKTP